MLPSRCSISGTYAVFRARAEHFQENPCHIPDCLISTTFSRTDEGEAMVHLAQKRRAGAPLRRAECYPGSRGGEHLDRGLMEPVIGSVELDIYLPEPSHTQIALGTEASFPFDMHVDGIGPHRHVEHRCQKGDVHVDDGLSGDSVFHAHREHAETGSVGVDIQDEQVPLIGGQERGVKGAEQPHTGLLQTECRRR